VYKIAPKNSAVNIVARKKKRITRNRPTLYAIQNDAKNKKKKQCRLYHEISLSSNALPRTSLPTAEGSPLSFILPFIYFASRLLCDGSGPKKTKKPIEDQMQRRPLYAKHNAKFSTKRHNS
jgi:hypothetical protein